MKTFAKMFFFFPLAILFFNGCGTVGMMVGGSLNQFTGNYGINLETTHSNIFDVITDVGKEMDLSVNELDKINQKKVLSSGFSSAEVGLIGKSSASSISVALTDSSKNLAVSIFVQGNFGYGTKESADKIFNDFKSKLLTKLKQS